MVGVALTEGLPVGVDVEQERDVQIDGLIRMTLSPQETDAFDLVPERDRDAAFFTNLVDGDDPIVLDRRASAGFAVSSA